MTHVRIFQEHRLVGPSHSPNSGCVTEKPRFCLQELLSTWFHGIDLNQDDVIQWNEYKVGCVGGDIVSEASVKVTSPHGPV